MRQINKEVREGVFRFKLYIGLMFFFSLVGAVGYIKYMMHTLNIPDVDLPTLFVRWLPILIRDQYFLLSAGAGGVAGLAVGWLFTRTRNQNMDGSNERPGMRQN
ncbi:MAG: hypothetical protein WAX67_01035 [Rugosibacter sp.]